MYLFSLGDTQDTWWFIKGLRSGRRLKFFLSIIIRVSSVTDVLISDFDLIAQAFVLCVSSSHSSVRVSVYRTLELWVQVAGASASILQGSPGHSELLFSHLLGDITPGAESVKVSSRTIYFAVKIA